MGLFNLKKKIEKFDIAREREKFFEMKYNQNENNITAKDKFIKFLEEIEKQLDEGVKERIFEISFELHELIHCKIEYEWFKNVTDYSIGISEICCYSYNDNPNTLIIKIRKL